MNNIYGQDGAVSQFGVAYRTLTYRARTETAAIEGLMREIGKNCGDDVVLRGGSVASWLDGMRWKARAYYHEAVA